MNEDVHHIYRVTQIVQRKPSEEMHCHFQHPKLLTILQSDVYDNSYDDAKDDEDC